MNLCFLIGKIVSDIKFDFIINSKNISIARFDLELSNKSIVTVNGYDNVADFCYKKLKKEDVIFIYGVLKSAEELKILHLIRLSKEI